MNVTRRQFLKSAAAASGAAALGALVTSPAKALAAESFEGYPDRFGVLTDTTMCVGCRSCERACNRVNKLPPPEKRFADPSVFAQQRRPTPEAWTVVNQYPGVTPGASPVFRKAQCMHCEEPACASSCLVGALKKTPEGPVLYDESICIGCRYCMNACPFTILSYTYDDPIRPAVKKCIMCYSKIKEEGTAPACVSACPVGANVFGKRSELLQTARVRISNNPDKYVRQIYGEKEAGGTGWLYLSAVPFEGLGLPSNLGSTPFPEFTRDFLLAVPLVLIGWPAVFLGINALSKRREKLALETGQADDAGAAAPKAPQTNNAAQGESRSRRK
jgi:formate dehydrogenase iron-sulfur subunit